jgi:gas vesicle protein
MEKSENTGKIVGALLLGAAIGGTIGAALGILFAPEKGKDMRRKLAATGDEFTGALKSKFTEFIEDVKSEAAGVKDRVSQYAEGGTTTIEK